MIIKKISNFQNTKFVKSKIKQQEPEERSLKIYLKYMAGMSLYGKIMTCALKHIIRINWYYFCLMENMFYEWDFNVFEIQE